MRTFFKHEMYKAKPKPQEGQRRSLDELDLSELIGKLDQELSFYVRGNAVIWHFSPLIPCYTCGDRYHWKNMDNGHYVGREWYGTRWDLRNLRPQCTKCNVYGEGQKFLYRQHLVEEGVDVKAVELHAQFVGKHKPARETLIQEIGAYREKNKMLRKALKEMGQ